MVELRLLSGLSKGLSIYRVKCCLDVDVSNVERSFKLQGCDWRIMKKTEKKIEIIQKGESRPICYFMSVNNTADYSLESWRKCDLFF